MKALRTILIACLSVACGLASSKQVHAQDDRCGAGKDLVVQALERVSPQADADAFQDALQLLKHAVSVCAELGDGWYYRSLVEQKLGHDALAKYAMDKARFNGSEALQQGLNPLVLSTPAKRGVAVDQNAPPTPGSTPAIAGRVAQKWALVIGISKFTDSKIPPLNFTTADATAFAGALTDPASGRFPADHVHVLINDRATTKNIKEELNWIARHAGINDIVVIYVATHGTPRAVDSAGGANYLVTYDTQIYNGSAFDEDALYATAYPMVELANAVATRMKALRTAVILDTCYSGGAAKGGAGSPADQGPSSQMLDRMSQGTGRIVLSASQVDEESLESPALKHGYFTYFLLQALKNGHGAAPLSAIFASVAQQVSERASADGSRQHPVMSRSSNDADFALGATGIEPVSPGQ
jgi:Uncharacterized protein containing caspase domain